jgi:hypothetical protein
MTTAGTQMPTKSTKVDPPALARNTMVGIRVRARNTSRRTSRRWDQDIGYWSKKCTRRLARIVHATSVYRAVCAT